MDIKIGAMAARRYGAGQDRDSGTPGRHADGHPIVDDAYPSPPSKEKNP